MTDLQESAKRPIIREGRHTAEGNLVVGFHSPRSPFFPTHPAAALASPCAAAFVFFPSNTA